MKTLANCSPREFLVQTNKIRKKASEWLSLTKIMEIRGRGPEITDGMTEEEKRAAVIAKAKENVMTMLDSIAEDHPDETVELLGMLCFLTPEETEQHTMIELLNPIMELIGNPEVINFFMSLQKLGLMGTSTPSKG